MGKGGSDGGVVGGVGLWGKGGWNDRMMGKEGCGLEFKKGL